MNTPPIVALGISLLATLGCASTQAQPVAMAAAACSQLDAAEITTRHLEPGQLHAAREVRQRQFLARALQPVRTAGADLYVHATPETSAEYLQRAFSCHASHGQALSHDDPFHPSAGKVTRVEVRSAGTGYAVRILGDDTRTGQEIWQRASALVEPPNQVTVEQLASAQQPATF